MAWARAISQGVSSRGRWRMKTESEMTGNSGKCSLGLTSEMLSTWLADGLDDQETERIRTHIPTCRECQNCLTAYNKLNGVLRAQRVPHPSENVWSPLRLRLLQVQQQVRTNHTPTRWRSLVGGLGVLAAILLVAVAFFQLFRSHSIGSSAVKLTWTKVSFPTNSVLAYGHKVAVSASDGDTAYVCTIASQAQTQTDTPAGAASVWMTRDRAIHWTQASPLLTARHDITACYVIVSDNQPSTALVVVSWSQTFGPQLSSDQAAGFVTTDSGVSWHEVDDPRSLGITQFAAIKGKIYALIGPACTPELPLTTSNDCLWHLYMISDSWQTWQPIWQPIDQTPTQNSRPIGARGFWLDPDTD